jgi:Ca-activated chloride channel family protein
MLIALCTSMFAQERTGRPKPTPPGKENRRIEENDVLRINTELVSMPVIVSDRKGNLVNGLKKNDFSVYDEGVLQNIALFSVDDAPASIVILFDTSGSMSGKKIERAKQALARFVETSHPKDEFFLITFDSRPRLVLDGTRDADALMAKLTYVDADGDTALYDAIYLGVEKVLRGAHPKKVVLMITDGLDNHSRYSRGDVKKQLEESGVLVYAIGVLRNMLPRQRLAGEDLLGKLSENSGGKAFFPDDLVETDEAFERVAVELRRQYSIAFIPSISDGRWHRINVTVPQGQKERMTVRTRKGYNAPAQIPTGRKGANER